MDAFFIFKRVVGMLAQPLALAYLLIALSLFMVVFGRRRLARFSLWLAVIVVVIASFPLLTRWMGRTLERGQEPFMPEMAAGRAPAAVVVLGNGVAHPGDAFMPAIGRLNDTSRARLVEGVRLARLYPEARLVVTGYGMGLENCADVMAGAAAELGIEADRIVRMTESLDTEHEARLVKDMVGDGLALLVTTAVHMPRTLEYFRESRVDLIPAPCDFIAPLSDKSLSDVNRFHWRPRGKNISDSEEVWHEYLGLAYHRWFRKQGSGG